MFSNQTYETIRNRVLDNIKINIDKREGSFTSDMISPVSVELAKAYIEMGGLLNLSFIDTNFDTFLDRRVNEFGVYRKEGKKATGELTVEGQEGVYIENGTRLKVNDLYFVVLNDITLPTEDKLQIEAENVGYKYNLLANTEFELVDKNDSITRIYNDSDLTNGVDVETDEELRRRFVKVVNNPSTSGNKAHYEEWALEVEGVGSAKVYPLWNGNGTVKVMITGNDNKPAAQQVITNCKTYIEENMPIGCSLTVTTPTLLNVNIVANIELSEGYEIQGVKEEFEEKLNNYLKDVTGELVYGKVYGMLISLLGVQDLQTLTLNGQTSNISIPEDKIIYINDIQLNEVM